MGGISYDVTIISDVLTIISYSDVLCSWQCCEL